MRWGAYPFIFSGVSYVRTFPVKRGVPQLVHLRGEDLTEVVKGELLLVLKSRLKNQRVHQALHLVRLRLALRKLQERPAGTIPRGAYS